MVNEDQPRARRKRKQAGEHVKKTVTKPSMRLDKMIVAFKFKMEEHSTKHNYCFKKGKVPK